VTLERLIAMTVLHALLAACATSEPPPASTVTQGGAAKAREHKQLKLQLASGLYRCELGQSIEIQRDSQNVNLIEVRWQGNRHKLQRHDSASGLPRYEDRENGLLWIDLPWKSVLMDANSGRPLANECKAAQGQTTRG
jgi:hypothetical protein